MTRLLLVILAILVVGNFFGLYALYKLKRAHGEVAAANNSLENLADILEGFYSKRMIFLHHSVGHGILHYGGLADSLRGMGIMVKSATYGDDIGNKTDICHWLTKFQNQMDRILKFKIHPNKYYADDKSNDIVMFKSCFPNSDLVKDGSKPGDPLSTRRTVVNYKAVFVELQNELKKHNDKLFIYLTAPPLVPEATTAENSERAMQFNRWLVNDFVPEYRRETGLDNLVVFDLFSLLTNEEDFLKKEYRVPTKGDSHPNTEANKIIAREFVAFFRPIWEDWQARLETKNIASDE